MQPTPNRIHSSLIYLVAHIPDVSLVLVAIGIIQISGEIESRCSEVSVVFLLLHTFSVDFCGASWARASEAADRVTAHETGVTRGNGLRAFVHICFEGGNGRLLVINNCAAIEMYL